ncbi:hypothetical protein ACM66B_003795 [Microbotryomycetes sp. NB124-2]
MNDDDDVPPPLQHTHARPAQQTTSKNNVENLLDLRADDVKLQQAISDLSSRVAPQQATVSPQVKAYSDVVYLNYHSIGVSVQLQPAQAYRPPSSATSLSELDQTMLHVSAIDIYNYQARNKQPQQQTSKPRSTRPPRVEYSAWPSYPLRITCPARQGGDRPTTLDITPQTLGQDFVKVLGEPDRKGGGQGSIGIWAEWTNLGLLVEFASSGLKAWDHGAEAQWKVLTLFMRGESRGQDTDE